MTTSSYESLSHSKWDCKYHIVFVPKNRKRIPHGRVRKYLGPMLHGLAGQRGTERLPAIAGRFLLCMSSNVIENGVIGDVTTGCTEISTSPKSLSPIAFT